MSKHDKEETVVAELAENQKPKLKGKEYTKELRKLQTEVCVLQGWVKHTGLRAIVIFEGRDAAGKGGYDQGTHREGEPPGVPGCGLAGAYRPGEDTGAYPALLRPLSGGR